jgi:UDPglucose--hexose-1-phosphate uridylyltransferase
VILENASQRDYYREHGRSLLADYLAAEQVAGERIVYENDYFTILVPFWAIWPYETMLISKAHVTAISELTGPARDGFADALRNITARYDNMFQASFPYSMGIHQRPTDKEQHPAWHLHAHFYPPLLRSSTVRKFMVGYEMLGTPQRDITPEQAANRLRDLSAIHY